MQERKLLQRNQVRKIVTPAWYYKNCFSRMFLTRHLLCCFECFAAGQHVDMVLSQAYMYYYSIGLNRLLQHIQYNRLINVRCIVKSRLRLDLDVYAPRRKRSHCFQLSLFMNAFHACIFRGIEDTYRTLTAIPFKVGVNNSSIVSIREKVCQVSVPV